VVAPPPSAQVRIAAEASAAVVIAAPIAPNAKSGAM
jgi:hypothetical protein